MKTSTRAKEKTELSELTDEIIAKQIGGVNATMIGVLIVAVLIFCVFFIVSLKTIILKKGHKASPKSSSNKGLYITTAITGAVCTFLLIGVLGSYKTADSWHIQYATVADKEIEVDDSSDTRTRSLHLVYVEGYDSEIKVSENEYDTITIGEDVYILVNGNHVDGLWETDKYQYSGNRLK